LPHGSPNVPSVAPAFAARQQPAGWPFRHFFGACSLAGRLPWPIAPPLVAPIACWGKDMVTGWSKMYGKPVERPRRPIPRAGAMGPAFLYLPQPRHRAANALPADLLLGDRRPVYHDLECRHPGARVFWPHGLPVTQSTNFFQLRQRAHGPVLKLTAVGVGIRPPACGWASRWSTTHGLGNAGARACAGCPGRPCRRSAAAILLFSLASPHRGLLFLPRPCPIGFKAGVAVAVRRW